MSAPDAPLRANVRLLGDVLGDVLVEQEGEELLVLEEQIRGLARDARDTGERAELEETIGALSLEQQAAVLRAFSIFFQLANIAEQHHRLRRRRQYEHEGRVPRESLADAVARLRDAGVGDDELLRCRDAARGAARADRASDRGEPAHDPPGSSAPRDRAAAGSTTPSCRTRRSDAFVSRSRRR